MAVPMSEFELARQQRIASNHARLVELGIDKQKAVLDGLLQPARRPATYVKRAPQSKVYRTRMPLERRRSKRLTGEKIDYCEVDEHDRLVHVATGEPGEEPQGLLDLMDRNGSSSCAARENDELQEQVQMIRCGSQGRGSLYDSVVGITCHFCRQKKLCGEENCPRCAHRDVDKECIGKTDCSRCHSAFGKFCRACLLIRYGCMLEDVQKQMDAGTWLCPHCYEDEHPDNGMICNSSICMKRRGLKPTGIAIYEAQERGFKSVAHLLQDTLKKRGGVKALAAEGAALDAPATQEGTAAEAPAGCSGCNDHTHHKGAHEAGTSSDGCEHGGSRRMRAAATAAAEPGTTTAAEAAAGPAKRGTSKAAAVPSVGTSTAAAAAVGKPPLAPAGGVAKRSLRPR